MIAARSPAGLDDVVSLHPGAVMPSAYWRALLVQLQGGLSVAFEDEGGPLMVVGLLPIGSQCEALWLAASPRASRRMVALTRALRLTMAAACHSRSVTVYGYVAPGHRPTARLLALLGFHCTGRDHGFDRWIREFEGTA